MGYTFPTTLKVNRIRDIAGALAIFAGLIHFIVVPHHFEEALEFGAFMVVIGAVQVVAGVLLLRRSSREVTFATSLLIVFVLATYAVVHTIGLPFGPHPGEPHAPHGIDLVSKTTELALLLALLVELRAFGSAVSLRGILLRQHDHRRRGSSLVRRRRFVALAPVVLGTFAVMTLGANWTSSSDSRDEMQLTDEPGNWFRSEATGGPVTTVNTGGRVDFEAGHLTNTRHTVTLVSRPTGSRLEVDQDDSKTGGIASATFDTPGLYLFLCKVHPYMTGVVLVRDRSGNVPPVTAEQFPFIGHLGASSLPASTVASVLPSIAPTNAEKIQKWDIASASDQIIPTVPGVGEVWIDTQFEAVPGQTDDRGVQKPGAITVVDAATFTVEREINGLDPDARGRWNNPHNMWTDTHHRTVYNGHWFGRWHNRIDRATGDVLETIEVGHAPTHTVTNPNERSSQFKLLTLPLSALDDFLKIRDRGRLEIVDKDPTGNGRNHPHGQWITSDGSKIVFPNVFKGRGVDGSISVVDLETSAVLKEFRGPAIKMPVAAGIQSVGRGNKAYVANIVSGQVSVIDLNTLQHVKDIPVTLTPDCQSGPQFDIFHTLQVPIQLPVSPDSRFVGVAVLSLTTVPRSCTGFADHVAIIDTTTDSVVKFVGVPASSGRAAGTHGANWGAKRGGGYYLHVANQFSNTFTVVNVDPNGDGNGADAAVVGRILLANGPGVTNGIGGQGIKPMPNVYDGWVQDTVAVVGETDPEVQSWIAQLTSCQKDPSPATCAPAGPGR